MNDRFPALLTRAGILVAVVAVALIITLDDWFPGMKLRVAENTELTFIEDGVLEAYRDLRIDGIAVRKIRNGKVYGTEDHFLFVSNDHGASFERRGVLPKWEPTPLERVRNRVARHPITRRLRENRGARSIAVLSSGTIILFYDRIYRSTDAGWTFEALPRPVSDFHGPFPHGVAVDSDDRVYFGEYRTDARPREVRVFRGTKDGSEWEICHTFPSGEIFHVHSASYDPVSSEVLVATGDVDSESGLFRLHPECEGVEPIGSGSQDWRIIAPLFTPEHIVWGSDVTHQAAQVFKWSRDSEELTAQHEIGKPSYHATQLLDGTLAISTVFEP